jgi:N-acetylglucosamine-6-phosphate deacetylase
MMSAACIENAHIIQPGGAAADGSVLLVDAKIAAFDPTVEQIPDECERVDAHGALLTPGLIDIHTHGIHEFLYERDPEDLVAGVAILPRYGTTCVLPTLYRVMDRGSLAKLERLANALGVVTGAHVPGFHLEGPFLALPGAGAATVPGDLVLLKELLSAANGRVRAMSISPDSPNIIPIIEELRSRHIAVFITHTRASAEQTQAAIEAGARHGTHFYDVFPIPPEDEPGVRPVGAVEALLADERCSVDFICDGVHVDPLAIRLALVAKAGRNVVAITDSNIGAGLDDGVYPTPWGYSVRVSENDAARVCDPSHPLDGLLAGSSLTMNRAMTNLLRWLDRPAHEIWAMGTCNPALAVGLNNKGVMQVGADADLVLWSEERGVLHAAQTWVRGECVFERETALA